MPRSYATDDRDVPDPPPDATRLAVKLPPVDLPAGTARDRLVDDLREHLEHELQRTFGPRLPDTATIEIREWPTLRVDATCPCCPDSPQLRPTQIAPAATGTTSPFQHRQPAPATTLRVQVQCPECDYSGTGIYRLDSLHLGQTPTLLPPTTTADSATAASEPP